MKIYASNCGKRLLSKSCDRLQFLEVLFSLELLQNIQVSNYINLTDVLYFVRKLYYSQMFPINEVCKPFADYLCPCVHLRSEGSGSFYEESKKVELSTCYVIPGIRVHPR